MAAPWSTTDGGAAQRSIAGRRRQARGDLREGAPSATGGGGRTVGSEAQPHDAPTSIPREDNRRCAFLSLRAWQWSIHTKAQVVSVPGVGEQAASMQVCAPCFALWLAQEGKGNGGETCGACLPIDATCTFDDECCSTHCIGTCDLV